MKNFIAMQREALDHVLFKGHPDRFYAWFWLVANAAWRPTRVRIKGETVTLERGELSFSVRFLAENWKWSKSKVDRFIADLREEGMISTRSKNGTANENKPGQGQSIITICNYNKYQDPEQSEWDNSGTTTGTTAGQQRDKEEQGNKLTIEEEPKGSSPSAPDRQSDHADIFSAWNAMAARSGLQPIIKLSDKRSKALKARLADHGLSEILRAIDQIPKSRFLLGANDRGWKADFNFLIKPDSILKILEGKYDDRRQTNRRGSSGGHAERDTRDGFQRAIDRKLGIDGYHDPEQPAGEVGRQDAGSGSGDSEMPSAEIIPLR